MATIAQTNGKDIGLTILEFIRYLAPSYVQGESIELPTWPPDAFAIVAAILQRSGAYRVAIGQSPPALAKRDLDELIDKWNLDAKHFQESSALEQWETWIVFGAYQWRDAWVADLRTPVPQAVTQWWGVLNKHLSEKFEAIPERMDLCRALLYLVAVSDEACTGVGSTKLSELLESADADAENERDWLFLAQAQQLLNRDEQEGGTTLCEKIHKSRIRVLPKARTTQRGLTFRSFSHHLALCAPSEVQPFWRITPRSGPNKDRHFLNLLLYPWPLDLLPGKFLPEKSPTEMAPRHELFKIRVDSDDELDRSIIAGLKKLLADAEKSVGKIDGVVFPECSLSMAQFKKIKSDPDLTKERLFLIAGVYEENEGQLARNMVRTSFSLEKGVQAEHEQAKHHRWSLDKNQILGYHLSSRLDPQSVWWEAIEVHARQVHFFAVEDWLTLCTLVCEDLARQDPVSTLVRSVGPNLVIALLADGPQLKTRWPHQYAAVLTDDPGSSVLSLTSLGMAKLSRPFQMQSSSRVVGLWKDNKTGAVELSLPESKTGLVLTLFREDVVEYTADGRSDQGVAALVVLGGILYV